MAGSRGSILLCAGLLCASLIGCDQVPRERTVYSTPHEFDSQLTGLQALWAQQTEQRLAAGVRLGDGDQPLDVVFNETVTSVAGRYRATIDPAPQAVVRGQTLEFTLRVEATDNGVSNDLALRLEVAGGMPLHSHGLPTQPSVVSTGEGRYALHGVKFSMPGWWQLMVGVTDAKTEEFDLLQFDFFVPP